MINEDDVNRDYEIAMRVACGVGAFAAAVLLWLFYEMWR